MKIQLTPLSDLGETNKFLRALWAAFRIRYGKCAWNYQPFKDGEQNRIFLGQLDIGVERTIDVALNYKTRSTLSEIEFGQIGNEPITPESGLGKGFSECVKDALSRYSAPESFELGTSVSCLRLPLAPYEGPSFRIHHLGKRCVRIVLRIHAFDRTDAESEFLRRLSYVIDTLSVETNHLFSVCVTGCSPSPDQQNGTTPNVNTFVEDEDWVDGHPVQMNCLLLSEPGFNAIETFVSLEQLSGQHEAFARACHHFHVAREQDALVNDRLILKNGTAQGDGSYALEVEADPKLEAAASFSRRAEELAAVLYLSAIEVASAIDAPPTQNCATCGQEQHRISARVADYIEMDPKIKTSS